MNVNQALFATAAFAGLLTVHGLWTKGESPSHNVPLSHGGDLAVFDAKLAASKLLPTLDVLAYSVANIVPSLEAKGDQRAVDAAISVQLLIPPLRESARQVLAHDPDPELIQRVTTLNAEFQEKTAELQEACSRYSATASLPADDGAIPERSWTYEDGTRISESTERRALRNLRTAIETEDNPYTKVYLEGVEQAVLQELKKVRAARGW